jgi:hypothetical protein
MRSNEEFWRHDVRIALRNAAALPKADSALIVEIRDEGALLGLLEIGRGSVIWWGRNKQRGKQIHWARFAQAMEETPGRKGRRARPKI